MLKKNDLAKQFELVVQQEIKNYNDSLNYVFGTLRQISEEIKDIKKQADERQAEYVSWKQLVHAGFNDIKKEVDHVLEMTRRNFDSQNRAHSQIELSYRSLERRFVNFSYKAPVTEEEIEEFKSQLSNLQKRFEKQEENLQSTVDRLESKMAKSLSLVKKEILYTPGELALVKRQLEEKIASHTVDVTGIMKELSIYKHDNYITDKKIENLYTQIERLKKKETQ